MQAPGHRGSAGQCCHGLAVERRRIDPCDERLHIDPTVRRGTSIDPTVRRGTSIDPTVRRGTSIDPTVRRGTSIDPTVRRTLVRRDHRSSRNVD
jgi:hypothetical protein